MRGFKALGFLLLMSCVAGCGPSNLSVEQRAVNVSRDQQSKFCSGLKDEELNTLIASENLKWTIRGAALHESASRGKVTVDSLLDTFEESTDGTFAREIYTELAKLKSSIEPEQAKRAAMLLIQKEERIVPYAFRDWAQFLSLDLGQDVSVAVEARLSKIDEQVAILNGLKKTNPRKDF